MEGNYLDFNVHLRFFYWFGLWPTKESPILYRLFPMVSNMAAFLFAISFAILIYYVDSVEIRIINFTLSVTYLHGAFKSNVILRNVNKIRGLFTDFENVSRQFAKDNEKEKREIFTRLTIRLMVRSIMYFTICMVTVFTWTFKNLFKDGDDESLARQNIQIPGWRRYYGIELWYPFVIDSYFRFFAVLILQLYVTVYISAAYGIVDPFIVALNEHLAAQFTVLGNALEKINLASEQEMNDKLVDCIRYHQTLLKLTKRIESLISFEAFLQTFNFSFIFCFLSYTVITAESIDYQIYGILSYCCSLLTQIFFLTRSGNLIYEKNMELATCAYTNDWPDSHLLFRKAIQFIIMRAQKPLRLTAMQLVTLNLETFTSVVNSSFSYVTLLRNLNK